MTGTRTDTDTKDNRTAIKLGNASLHRLPSRVAAPGYDRSRLTPGIVHIGVGGFHRAHQAVYLDDALATSDTLSWGICGVGLLPHDRRMAEALIPRIAYTQWSSGARTASRRRG